MEKSSDTKLTDTRQKSTGKSEAVLDAEKKLNEFLKNWGVMAEPGLDPDSPKAEKQRRLRQKNYKNINSLLSSYRSLSRTYELFKEEFTENVLRHDASANQSINIPEGEERLFDRLSQELDLFSAEEEKRFQAVWAPQVVVGRRIEYAIYSIKLGLKFLSAQSEMESALLRYVFIDGDEKPSVKDACEKFSFYSSATYYKRLNEAKKHLTELTFFYCSNKAELSSILTYLRQQQEDSYFPDGID